MAAWRILWHETMLGRRSEGMVARGRDPSEARTPARSVLYGLAVLDDTLVEHNDEVLHVEVLAVEIKQYVGGESKVLVPRVMGQTVEAQRKKSGAPPKPSERGKLTASSSSISSTNCESGASPMRGWASRKTGTTLRPGCKG